VRHGQWRYTEWAEGAQGVELYDEVNDRRELHNLAQDPQHAKTVAALKRLLQEMRTQAAPKH
jgi:iduronate 2-sulfatase